MYEFPNNSIEFIILLARPIAHDVVSSYAVHVQAGGHPYAVRVVDIAADAARSHTAAGKMASTKCAQPTLSRPRV